ncbi:helix-turn-helix domain-containing protein [Rathayibacter sp. CAU 1779]
MARFDVTVAPSLVSAARRDAGLTQRELAERAGIAQPNLAAIEAGRRVPSDDLLERILRAADYRPSTALRLHRSEVEAIARRFRLENPRVFGSVATGTDGYTSDIDLLVDLPSDVDTLRAYAAPEYIERLLGFPVDMFVASAASGSEIGNRVLAEAVPL